MNSISRIKKKQHGVTAAQTGDNAATNKKCCNAEKNACNIDAMLNGGTCEACQ